MPGRFFALQRLSLAVEPVDGSHEDAESLGLPSVLGRCSWIQDATWFDRTARGCRSEPADKLRYYERLPESSEVCIYGGDEPLDGEAVGPSMRLFGRFLRLNPPHDVCRCDLIARRGKPRVQVPLVAARTSLQSPRRARTRHDRHLPGRIEELPRPARSLADSRARGFVLFFLAFWFWS